MLKKELLQAIPSDCWVTSAKILETVSEISGKVDVRCVRVQLNQLAKQGKIQKREYEGEIVKSETQGNHTPWFEYRGNE